MKEWIDDQVFVTKLKTDVMFPTIRQLQVV